MACTCRRCFGARSIISPLAPCAAPSLQSATMRRIISAIIASISALWAAQLLESLSVFPSPPRALPRMTPAIQNQESRTVNPRLTVPFLDFVAPYEELKAELDDAY